MPLQREPDCSLEPQREELWAKRCAAEDRSRGGWRRRAARDPYWEGSFHHAVRRVLEAVGIYRRGMANANRPELHRHTFCFDGLSAGLDGFRILHLSDFHFCDRYDCADLVLPLISGLDVDVVVMTGDFQFRPYTSAARAGEGVRRVVAAVTSRHGAYAVLGNNDTGEMADVLEQGGVRVLVNEGTRLDHSGHALWLVGVDDPHEFRTDSVARALERVPLGAFTVLLAHSPEIIAQAAAYGVDLYLCGHTHGGQVRLPWIGALRTNARCRRRFARGVWRSGAMRGYTTTGLGISALPIRFNCPPEVALLELRGVNG